MPYTFTLTTTIPATPEEIYEAWLDSRLHSEMSGGEATQSDQIGAEVSAWDGYITGRNLELIPSERIVQSWRTTEFDDEHADSVITVVLEEVDGDTVVTLEHSNVPNEHKSYEEGGWQSNYFEPMVTYFSERRKRVAKPARREARSGRASKASPKKTTKRQAKSTGKTKRAASARKSKREKVKADDITDKTKSSPKKSKGKSKGKAGAAAARRRANGAPKSRRGKRK
jgi:uncharacterized protein YndB with AHSA1/START domain